MPRESFIGDLILMNKRDFKGSLEDITSYVQYIDLINELLDMDEDSRAEKQKTMMSSTIHEVVRISRLDIPQLNNLRYRIEAAKSKANEN